MMVFMMNCSFMQHIFCYFYISYIQRNVSCFLYLISHIYFQPHLLNFTFLSFSVNGSKEADGDGEGDKTDAQGNNSTTKVNMLSFLYPNALQRIASFIQFIIKNGIFSIFS